MEITDVQVKLIGNGDDRLKASCTIAIDAEFVIRDVKVIEGTNGLFVAMPSRKLTDHCPKCGHKNHLRSKFCNNCGGRLSESRHVPKEGAQQQLHAEIAHPINSECRERLHNRVIAAYEEARRQQPAAPSNGRADMRNRHDSHDDWDSPHPSSSPEARAPATNEFGAGLLE
jgi:stage V sporulation protein G